MSSPIILLNNVNTAHVGEVFTLSDKIISPVEF